MLPPLAGLGAESHFFACPQSDCSYRVCVGCLDFGLVGWLAGCLDGSTMSTAIANPTTTITTSTATSDQHD